MSEVMTHYTLSSQQDIHSGLVKVMFFLWFEEIFSGGVISDNQEYNIINRYYNCQ